MKASRAAPFRRQSFLAPSAFPESPSATSMPELSLARKKRTVGELRDDCLC